MPPSVSLSAEPVEAASGDLLALPFFAGPRGPEPGPGVAAASRVTGAGLTDALRQQGFAGLAGEHCLLLVPGGRWPRGIAAIGMGAMPAMVDDGCATDAIRDAAQGLAQVPAGSATVATTLAMVGDDEAASVRAVAEGFLLGGYRPGRSGHRPIDGEYPDPPAAVTLLVRDVDATCQDALDRGTVAAETENWVRDLVHAPAAVATPAALAEQIAARAAECGAQARVWAATELAGRGFGGVLGVGQGSRNESRLLEVSWLGSAGRPIALAGKGITFDSGGLNLKRDPDEIAWMRSDMAGGAAVAGAVIAAARLGLKVHVVAVVPLAENMPGGGSVRPGDVLTHYGGRTSEVIDTDCEGRLVVADALAYLAERDPAALIDVATLTDAAGLGPALWAAMGTDQALLREVLGAGQAAGEPGWQLPLPASYRSLLSSAAADLRNTPRHGPDSTVMAATFLREFAGDVPWVHIDNGSTAWLEYDAGVWPEGATGSPTRALIRFLESRAAA